jgi:hypothetical protein
MKTSGCFLLVFMALSVQAWAAGDVTLFGGLQHPGKITLRSSVSNAVTQFQNPINVGVFGIRVGHGTVWGGEHTLAFTPNFLDSESKAVIYNSNLRIQAPTPVVKPYVTAGLGSLFTSGQGITDLGAKFAVNYGGGVKFMAGRVGVGVDARGYSVPSIQSQTLNLFEVSLGVVFGF